MGHDEDSGWRAAPAGARRLDRTGEPRLAEVLDYWLSKCRGRRMPARADIDPLDLGALLPTIYLVDVLDDPPDFRYRLIGTDIVANTRTDHTGRRLGELVEEGTQGELARIYAEVRDRGEPAIHRIAYLTQGGNERYYDNLVLPLGDERVVMLLGSAVHYWREGGAGRLTTAR